MSVKTTDKALHMTYLQSLIEQMISSAGSGHYASSMSALEIMYPLFYEQGITPDCFILSKGHAAPALYAILFDLGYLGPDKDSMVESFRMSYGLPGHPELGTPGVTASSGSLGMGISKAIGLAYANPDKVYHVLVGDGELQEGQNWEALLYIIANNVPNIIIHIDANRRQYSGMIPGALVDIPLPSGRRLIVHRTSWQHDNSYLTTPDPAMDSYKQIVIDYSCMLHKAMSDDNRIIVLNADLEQDFQLTFIRQSFPDRYIQCGISEQHMVSMANGLALAGKIPICHGFGAFYRRALDQIYNSCCDGLPIMYVAGLCGNHPTLNIGHSHWDCGFGDALGLVVPGELLVTINIDEAFGSLGKCPIYLMLEYPKREN